MTLQTPRLQLYDIYIRRVPIRENATGDNTIRCKTEATKRAVVCTCSPVTPSENKFPTYSYRYVTNKPTAALPPYPAMRYWDGDRGAKSIWKLVNRETLLLLRSDHCVAGPCFHNRYLTWRGKKPELGMSTMFRVFSLRCAALCCAVLCFVGAVRTYMYYWSEKKYPSAQHTFSPDWRYACLIHLAMVRRFVV